MDLMSAGSFMSGLGSLASAFGSGSGNYNRAVDQWRRELEIQHAWRTEDYQRAVQAGHLENARQKEFAQMGIRWKAADAAAAGFHPLAVLGGQGAMYSPTIAVTGGTQVPGASMPSGGRVDRVGAIGDAMQSFAQMGQSTARAQIATQTAYQREMEAQAIERAKLENANLQFDLLTKAHQLNASQYGPPMPGPVGPTPPVGAVETLPSQRVSSMPGQPAMEAASTPLEKVFDMGGGAKLPLPSEAAAQSMEAYGPLGVGMAMTISGLRRFYHGPENPDPDRLYWSVARQRFVPLSERRAQEAQAIDRFRSYRSGRGNARTR